MALSRTLPSRTQKPVSQPPKKSRSADVVEEVEDSPPKRPRKDVPSRSREVAVLPKRQLALPPPEEDTPEDTEESSNGKAVEAVRLLPGVRKSSLRRLHTMFGQRSDDIIDLLELDNADGALAMISKTLLQTLVDVIPVVERNVRRTKGQRGVYQLNQVISQVREMCHDIQAYKDKSQMGSMRVERVIRPSYLDIAVQITAAFAELETGARARMKKDDFEDYKENFLYLMKRNLATYMSQQYETVSENVVKSY